MGCLDCCASPKESREPIRYNAEFEGPVHNRSCTDIIWLIIFIVFLGGWGFLGYYGAMNGNIEKLLAPVDSKGRRCGIDAGLVNKKYLVFFNIAQCLSPNSPITGCSTPQVCVEECPKRTILFENVITSSTFEQYRQSMICTDDVDTRTMTYTQAVEYIKQEKCAKYVIQSQPVLYRCIGDLSAILCKKEASTEEVCLRMPGKPRKSPLVSATAVDTLIGSVVASWIAYFTNNNRDTDILSAQIVQDLVQSRWYLVGALVAVVLVCFLYILLLRWVIAPVVWISIVGLIGVLGFSLYLIYNNYVYYRDNPVGLYQTTNLKGYAQSIFAKHQTWMAILVIVAIILVILVLIAIFLRKRISIAIALIKEGSKAVCSIKSTVFFPIFPWILQCLVILYGLWVLMNLMSIGESAFKVVNLKYDENCDCQGAYTEDYVKCDPVEFALKCHNRYNPLMQCQNATCHFTGLDSPTSIYFLHLANLLGFFWVIFFIGGVSDMILASAFATWYWTFRKRNLPFFVLTSGFFRTFRYHLGTVAFGSLIIAIVRVIRVILEYIDHKIKKFDNAFTRCLLCCLKCFFWCLENFLKFINKNAYIMCAVHGESFCKSARDAFSLLMRNIVRVVVLDKVTDFIFFLSKMLISLGVGFGVYYLLQWNLLYEATQAERLHYNYIPAIILSVATYIICTLFFNVYAVAVDTLFLCFLEDCERNDGSPEKPYFMSKDLMKILGKKNKI